MHLTLALWRLASLGFGAVALLRLSAVPDSQLRHGVRTRIWWTAVVLFGGMGALLPVGPLWVYLRTRPGGGAPLPSSVVPPVPYAHGAPLAAPVASPPAAEGSAPSSGSPEVGA